MHFTGDRYEVFQLCFAFFNYKVPILHIGGGDITIGSQDNIYRNLISLMSSYHFVTNKGSQKNLKKLEFQTLKYLILAILL